MSQENDSTNDRLDKISEAIAFLSGKVSFLEQEMNKEKKKNGTEISYSSNAPALSQSDRETPDVPLREAVRHENSFVVKDSLKDDIGKVPEKTVPDNESFEAEIGLKWLGRIGILALVFGLAFFLKYAFENDWIGEAGRVVIGILSGVALIYLGDYLRSKYNEYAATLTGGGIAVLYLSIYSSFAYYQLIGQVTAFIAMMVITMLGAYLAIYYDRINLAALAVAGGFLTPILLSTHTNNQIELFSYITILNLGVLVISYYKNWQKLNLLGLVFTALLFISWLSSWYIGSSQLFVTEAFWTLWFFVYAMAIVLNNIVDKRKTTNSDLSLMVVNALVYFGISYALLLPHYSDYMGFFAVLMAALYFVFAYIFYEVNHEDSRLALFLPGVSIFFLTIAAPIQFDGIWVTIAWALEAVVLMKGGFYLKNYAMCCFSWILLTIVVIRLVFIDNYEKTSAVDFAMILNKRFLTVMVGVIAFGMVYALYSKNRDSVEDKDNGSQYKMVALFLVNFLLLWNLSSEVSLYFNHQIATQTVSAIRPDCPAKIDARGKYVESTRCDQERAAYANLVQTNAERTRKIQGTESAALTILWALYAIGLLAIGFWDKNRFLRLMGIGLFGIVIAKLFLHDLWSLGGIYRIVSSITLGVILLSASYAYNRYREKIKEII